jgi:EAL domain-containing protein (putative c-di-GMP-specific phosphodiesterase class I)
VSVAVLFVEDAPDDAELLLRELRLTVVAEGVETREELAFVREHGCDQVQGFLFSRPVPAEGATELVARGAFAL